MLKRLVPVVAALILAVAAAVQTAQVDTTRPPVGIFLVGANGAETKIVGQVSGETQSHGMVKSIVSQGIMKPSFTVRFAGASADCVIADPQPAFVFRLPNPKQLSQMAQGDPMAMMAMMSSGDNMLGGTNPGVFTLGKLSVDGDGRVASSKGMDTFKFTSHKRDAPNEYDIKVSSPLQPGEYAFFVGKGGAPNAIWGFSLKSN
jgi:hypothetical protein